MFVCYKYTTAQYTLCIWLTQGGWSLLFKMLNQKVKIKPSRRYSLLQGGVCIFLNKDDIILLFEEK